MTARRRVAVAGGGGGIGDSICRRLDELGWRTYALDLRAATDSPAQFVACDLLSEASIEHAVAALYRDDPAPIDLVNSAGIVENDVGAEDMDTALLDTVMGVNFRGTFLTCKHFGRELLQRGGGAIVNVASMSGNLIVNYPQRQSVYNASKAAVTALTKSLAVEWTPRGVRVNAISPGYIDTPLNALKPDMHAEWISGTVAGRMGTPLEVADAVEYLLSDRSAFCVGTELVLDGGFSLR